MPESNTNSRHADLGAALGRVPSGLFILTARNGENFTGMLASWVQQAGFEPPMLTVVLHKDRYVTDWIRRSGKFVLNQVAIGNKTLLKHFGKGFKPEDQAFENAKIHLDHPAGPVLAEALCYLVVELVNEVTGTDHVVLLGKIVEGGMIDPEGQPMVHTRQSGLHY